MSCQYKLQDGWKPVIVHETPVLSGFESMFWPYSVLVCSCVPNFDSGVVPAVDEVAIYFRDTNPHPGDPEPKLFWIYTPSPKIRLLLDNYPSTAETQYASLLEAKHAACVMLAFLVHARLWMTPRHLHQILTFPRGEKLKHFSRTFLGK